MKNLQDRQITELVRKLCIRANLFLRKDILASLQKALANEKNRTAKNILNILIENAKIAANSSTPICQDTGIVEVFCDIGQDVCVNGNITQAINKGVSLAYRQACLRKSVVSDPIIRKNTNTNTPCIAHYNMTKGDKIKIAVLVKGFGSENASAVKMLKPTDSEEDIINSVIDIIKLNGPDACPPLFIGIGLGGTLDKAALLATEAILLPVDKKNPKRHLARIEKTLLKKINLLGIGPAGLGGKTTCLGVNILSFPTHIAGLPLCVKISCHATRSAKGVI
jgi:fumarate hydratase subunit alpha